MDIPNSTAKKENTADYFNRSNISRFYLKIILIFNFLLILSAVIIILFTKPFDSYEFSIYSIYPSYFWIILIISITLGMTCAIISVLNDSLKNYWYLGFLAEVIAFSLVLFLPMIRGYFIYGSGDVLTHIGNMLDIDHSGTIGRNHYPILHILGVSLHVTTSLSYGIITMLIPPIFSVFSILFWYALAKEIMDDIKEIVILLIITAIPIYGVMNSLFTPNHQAFLLIPLILYGLIKYQKTKNKKIGLILILLSTLMAIIHPLVAVMVIFLYILIYISDIIFSNLFLYKKDPSNILKFLFVTIMIFLTWSTYLLLIIQTLKPLIASILGTDEISSELASKLDLLSKVNADILYLINLGLLNYGIHLILALLTLVCIATLFYLHSKSKVKIYRFQFFTIICFIVFCFLGTVVFLKLDLFGMKRIFNFALIFSCIIISSTIVIIYDKFRNSKYIKNSFFLAITIIILIIFVYLSIFSLHLSPIIKQSHQQVTEGNYKGMKTFFETRDTTIPILENGVSQMRYFDLIYGESYPAINIRYGDMTRPIDHFGYNNSFNMGSNYHNEQYFLLSKEGRGFYENMYPEFPDKWRFTEQDFQMLDSDESVQRMYSNKNLNIYLIKQTFQLSDSKNSLRW